MNLSDKTFIMKIPGYDILAQIDVKTDFLLYRVRNISSGEISILKVLRTRNPSPSELARFRHEYEIIKSANIDGVVKILAVIDIHDDDMQAYPALVEKEFTGLSLSRLIRPAIPLDKYMDLAIRMAQIVENIHRHNISHRNLNARNVYCDEQPQSLKIANFGIISELTGSAKRFYDPWTIKNILPYISPEQTGRMNRDVDYRTDLYSLGIILYEMVTGNLPFSFDNPMDIIYAHIAKEPEPPKSIIPAIPAALSGIIMKLLSKTPEERYQTSLGLTADLVKCRDQMKVTGHNEAFVLGQHDICLKFNMPRALVGRQQEIKMLTEAFESASMGKMAVTFISGEPGVGKSSLVNEIEKTVIRRKGFFLTGKYGQIRRHTPYSAILMAFESLAEQILTQSEERIQYWKKKILTAVGSAGKIITDMIPRMEPIIGIQAALPDLGAEEAKNLLKLVFKRFAQVFADREHPVLLFLDDLHWADPASLDLIKKLAEDGGLEFFCLIGTWRENEVPAHHLLRKTMDATKKTDVHFQNLTVKSLDAMGVNSILTGFLRCRPDTCAPLADILHEKTLGNPFFINQFIKILYEEKYLEIDISGEWRFDLNAIKNLQVTDNVVDFMAKKLRKLPSDVQEIIGICACIGNRFDTETLTDAAGKPISDILQIIDRLLLEGFIISKQGFYFFGHDRIYEAAYYLRSSEKQKQTHYRIGKKMLENIHAEELHKQLFYITDQINHGNSLIATTEEARQLAGLNLKAGIKARDAAAFSAAVNYLQQGIDLLNDDAWQSDYDLVFSLYRQQMECRYIIRDFDEAERLFNVITTNAGSNKDKAKACITMIVLYTNKRSFPKALELGVKALELYDVKISTGIGPLPVLIELIKVKWRLRKIDIEEIANLPQMHDPDQMAKNSLILAMAMPAFYVNQHLFAYIILKAANGMLKNGLSLHAEINFIGLAAIIQNVFSDYDTGYRMGEMAIALNQRFDNRGLAGQVLHTFAFFIQHWKKHARHDIDVYRKAYQMSLDAGNLIYAGHSVNATTDCRLMIGDPLDEIIEESKKYEQMMDHVKDPFITARFRENIQMARCLMGFTADCLSLNGNDFDETAYTNLLFREKNLFGLGFSLLYKLMLLYLHGKYASAGEIAESLDRYIDAPIGTLVVPLHHFYASLTLAAIARDKKGHEKRRLLLRVKKYQRKMKQWARLCPENFAHKHDLVEAELTAVAARNDQGNDNAFRRSLQLYHAAIEGARKNAYSNEEAVSCERMALFYLDMNAKEEAGIYIQRAHKCLGIWKAAALQKGLEGRYPDFFSPISQEGPASGRPYDSETGKSPSGLLDLDTVMKVSRAISSEIVLDRLLEIIMEISITNAGAQKGFLILDTDEKLTVEAGIDPDRKISRIEKPIPLQNCPGLSGAIVNYVFRTMEPVILANASETGPFKNDAHVMANKCKSILCMPILNKSRITGILYMENNLGTNAFTKKRLEILGIIAGQAAVSLENARLFEMATTDGLTRLFVHRYFQFLLDQEMTRSLRYGRPCSLLMIDIDNFKHFNDTYGHQAGDKVLKKLAQTLIQNTRAVDVSARYGGEEFVVILPETKIEDAMIVGEKIIRAIDKIKIHHDHHTLKITASIGAATFPDHAASKTELIRLADKALYLSKKMGKNRISQCTSDNPSAYANLKRGPT